MFPSAKTRFAAAARRGFGLAVEFATLGEYQVAQAPEPLRRARPLPPPASAPVRPRANTLRPATAAARRLQPLQPQRERISSHSGMRALAFDARRTRKTALVGRKRAGAARPRPQPCLVAEAGGSGAMDG